MDFDLFRRLADEASGRVGQFNLFHRGESLLHPQIGEMVRYAVDRGIHTRINTNGTRLTDDMGRKLIESELDILSFSFDGYDREMYEKNRPNASFDEVLTNIVGFLRRKKSSDSKKPFVAIEVMELADNTPTEFARMRAEFLKRFAGLPLDKFVIRKPHNWGGMLSVGPDQSRAKQSCIACPLLWHALVVFWDGRVMPCPQDFFGKLQIGNANDESLMDIWNGKKLRSLRADMADMRTMSTNPCVECDRITRATFAGVPVDYLGRFLSENLFGNNWLSRILPH
jgi:radical SAM protein with 4Fe4S-binding SPASM domain